MYSLSFCWFSFSYVRICFIINNSWNRYTDESVRFPSWNIPSFYQRKLTRVKPYGSCFMAKYVVLFFKFKIDLLNESFYLYKKCEKWLGEFDTISVYIKRLANKFEIILLVVLTRVSSTRHFRISNSKKKALISVIDIISSNWHNKKTNAYLSYFKIILQKIDSIIQWKHDIS